MSPLAPACLETGSPCAKTRLPCSYLACQRSTVPEILQSFPCNLSVGPAAPKLETSCLQQINLFPVMGISGLLSSASCSRFFSVMRKSSAIETEVMKRTAIIRTTNCIHNTVFQRLVFAMFRPSCQKQFITINKTGKDMHAKHNIFCETLAVVDVVFDTDSR
jgi:hypothetical protein